MPVLDLLSSFSKNAQHLSGFFRQSCILENGFPVKSLIPVYASVKLLVHLDSITLKTPDKDYFCFPKHEEWRSEDTTAKIDWTSDLLYHHEISYSDDDNLLEAQELYLSIKSFEIAPLLTDISDDVLCEEIIEGEMPEVSEYEDHHKLPTPKNYNRNNLNTNTIIKKKELFKKVKIFVMYQNKKNKNDADILL